VLAGICSILESQETFSADAWRVLLSILLQAPGECVCVCVCVCACACVSGLYGETQLTHARSLFYVV
jgi:hypothetical protein